MGLGQGRGPGPHGRRRPGDEPGGLAGVLELLEQNQINIEYMYAFVGRSGADAVVVFRVEDDGIDRAVTLLQQHQIKLFDEKDSIF